MRLNATWNCEERTIVVIVDSMRTLKRILDTQKAYFYQNKNGVKSSITIYSDKDNWFGVNARQLTIFELQTIQKLYNQRWKEYADAVERERRWNTYPYRYE